MNKFTRALVLGLATSAFAIAGCASSNACNSKSSSECDTSEACVDCTDPNCEKCAATEACVDCGGPANCEKCAAKAATLGAINESCPFSGDPVNADIKTISFQGQEVGFCCNGCVGKFAKMTETERANLLEM